VDVEAEHISEKIPPYTAHLVLYFCIFFPSEGHSPLLLTGVPAGSSDCNTFVHRPLFPHTPYQIRPFWPTLAPSRPNKKRRRREKKKLNKRRAGSI